MSKKCTKCKKEKALVDFYRDQGTSHGRQSRCKSCARQGVYEWRINNFERRRKYLKDSENSNRIKMQIKSYTVKNKEKVIAQKKVHQAIKKGSIVREPCVVCGEIKSEGHHEDYTKPLDVVWLCRLHHKERHANLNAREKGFINS